MRRWSSCLGGCVGEHHHRPLPLPKEQAEQGHEQHQALPGQPLQCRSPLPSPLPPTGALERGSQAYHHCVEVWPSPLAGHIPLLPGGGLQDCQLPGDAHSLRLCQQPHCRQSWEVMFIFSGEQPLWASQKPSQSVRQSVTKQDISEGTAGITFAIIYIKGNHSIKTFLEQFYSS